MVNEQTLRGNWNEIVGKLRHKWGQLAYDDLQAVHGSMEQLVGLIQRKTGEARSSIENYLEELTGSGASTASHMVDRTGRYATHAVESVQQGSHQAAETFRRSYGQASDSFRHGFEQAEHLVQERPAQSVAVCFGVGVLAGVLLGLVVNSR